MRKIISMILAMAMILSMTAFAKVADTTAGDFDYRYSLYEIFNEDFNGFKTTDTKITCQGVDLDVKDTEGKVINPTKYAYVERAAGNMALELTVDEDIMATAAKGQRPYLGIHGGSVTPPAGGSATYNVASFPGAQALIMEYEINFPEITTEPNKSVQFMFRLGQPGTKQYSFYASTAAEVTEDPSTKFSFRSGTNYVNVVEGKWHKVTEVVDLEEMVIHRYIDGALLGTTDISASGEIVQGGYYRVIGYEFLEQGIMLDNCHYYWAYDVAPVDNSNPYKYASFGSEGLTFDGYTMNASNQFVKSDSSLASVYGKNIGATKADSTWTIADDPKGGSNKVLAIDTTNGSNSTYYNVSSSLHAPAEGTALVYTLDFYLDSEVGGTDQKTLMMSKWLMKPDGNSSASSTGIWTYLYAIKSGNSVIVKQGNNGSGGFAGKNIATVSLDEWHTVTFVGTQAGDGYIYVDGKLVSTDEIYSGYYMAGIDYMRFSLNKAGGTMYFDNFNIYEGITTAAGITATDYTAGTSKVGDSVTLTATSYVIGQNATIEKSTDGTTWTDLGTASATVALTEESVYYRTKAGNLYSDTVILYGVQGATGHPYKRIYKEGPKLIFDDLTIVEPTASAGGSFKRNNIAVTGWGGQSIIAGEAGTKATIADSPAPAYTGDKAFVYSVNKDEATKKSAIFSQQGVGSTASNLKGTGKALVLEFDHYVSSADAGSEAKSNLQLLYIMRTPDGGSRGADVAYLSRAANGTWTFSWSGATIHNATAYKENQWNHIEYIHDDSTNISYVYMNDELVATKNNGAALLFDYIRSNGFATVTFPLYMDNWHMYAAELGDELVTTKKVWTNLDFEGLTITNNKVSTSAGTPIQNSVNGYFSATAELELQTSSTDATPNGEKATLSIEAVPTNYAAGHGDALKYAQTGAGYYKTPTMILMYLGNGGNNFGSPNADGNTPQAGDAYVTEFDFAFDSTDMDGSIEIAQFRGSLISGRYVTLAKNASNHFTFAGMDCGITIEGNKWYHVKVVADPATSFVRCYVDGVFAGTKDYSSTGLGLFESLRLFGGTNVNANGVSGLWYDNFNAYVEGAYVAPTTADIKLSKIAYDNGTGAVDTMADYAQLNATATVTNNGVAGQAVVIFARYTNGGKKLAAIAIKPITMAAGQTAISVKGELGASSATDKVKVFIWDGLGTLVPGVTTANNAEL